MITFESQEDFEAAVMSVIVDKLGLSVSTRGSKFVEGVTVRLFNKDDGWNYITEGHDSV